MPKAAFSKKKIALIALPVLAVIGYLAFGGDGAEETGAPAKVVVGRGNIEEMVTAQGKLEPKEYVNVGAQVSGILEKLNVEIGSDVKAGDLIAQIDAKVYRSQVEGDEAQLKTLQASRQEQLAQVELNKLIMERNKKLIAVNAVSQQTFEEAQTALKISQAKLLSIDAQLQQAASELEKNKANLEYTTIYAPITGTVVSQTVQEGETLNANQTTPTIVQVANLDLMTVRAQVAEADISRLKEGMEVYFTTLGSNNRRWTGTVRQILPTPETVNDVVLFNVLMDVENKDRALMTSMSTQMFFVLGRAENAVVIPASALVKRAADKDAEGQAYEVLVAKGGDPEPRFVQIGLVDRNNAQVLNGIEEGETLVLPSSVVKPDAAKAAPRGGARGPRL